MSDRENIIFISHLQPILHSDDRHVEDEIHLYVNFCMKTPKSLIDVNSALTVDDGLFQILLWMRQKRHDLRKEEINSSNANVESHMRGNNIHNNEMFKNRCSTTWAVVGCFPESQWWARHMTLSCSASSWIFLIDAGFRSTNEPPRTLKSWISAAVA